MTVGASARARLADPNPPIWRDREPGNRIAHAVISGNPVTLTPLSSATPAPGRGGDKPASLHLQRSPSQNRPIRAQASASTASEVA